MRYLCRLFLTTSMLVFFCATSLQAAPVGYTVQTSFMAALPGPASVLDFDSMIYGDIIASGDTVNGITFTYDFGGVQMMVTDDDENSYPTTTSPNLLGTTDLDMLQDGDDFELTFAPSYAIGMYFITTGDVDGMMYDDDITLTAGGVTVGLNSNDAMYLGTDTSSYEWYAYFLGIVDSTNPFTGADITTIGGGYFLYNVDDITTAPVPEPTTLALVSIGLIGLVCAQRRRCRL